MKIVKQKEKQTYNHYGICTFLVVIAGIFLLPKIAYLSEISNEKIIELTNKERQIRNIPLLESNNLLSQAAEDKAKDILNNQIFAHTINNKTFSSWIKEAGYKYSYVGENLAIDFVESESVIKAWLDSPLHKKNLLNSRFEEIGIAVIEDKFENEKSIIVVQVFGKPLNPVILGEIEPKNNQKITPAQTYLVSNTHSNSTNQIILEGTQNFFKNQSLNKIFIQLNILSLVLLYTALSLSIITIYLYLLYLHLVKNLFKLKTSLN